MGVLCFIAAVKMIKDSSPRAFLLIAGGVGLLIGACLFGYEVYQIAVGFHYYGDHTFLLLNKCISALMYLVSFGFYYTAFIFNALFKNKESKESEKVKVVLKK